MSVVFYIGLKSIAIDCSTLVDNRRSKYGAVGGVNAKENSRCKVQGGCQRSTNSENTKIFAKQMGPNSQMLE